MPSALAVVKSVCEEGKGQVFKLDEEALEKLLMDPTVKDMKVCVISIAGAFRKGKSFLMNFLLRYLSLSPPGNGDWMQPDERGFESRGGSELITEGILLWSEPFILHDKQGEEVAVFLMDTQGLYDHKSTVKNCTTIFALSTLLSSVTIYNVSQVISMNDLHQMHLFTMYAKMAMEHGGEKPFQRLMFLVRDWQWEDESKYGLKGGGNYLDKELKVTSTQAVELQEVRKHIKSFEQIECFLMPQPRPIVATGALDEDFKKQLRDLVPRLCSKIKPNEKTIVIRLLTGTGKGKELVISPVRHTHGTTPHSRDAAFERIQLPLKPSFAMTVNKSQGQSLKRVSLYLLDGEVFSHGALYVAFSRATTKDGIRVLPLPTDSESETRRPRNWIRNVVWPEVLDEEDRPALRRPPPTTHYPGDAGGRPYSMVHDDDIGGERIDDENDEQQEVSVAGASPSHDPSPRRNRRGARTRGRGSSRRGAATGASPSQGQGQTTSARGGVAKRGATTRRCATTQRGSRRRGG